MGPWKKDAVFLGFGFRVYFEGHPTPIALDLIP